MSAGAARGEMLGGCNWSFRAHPSFDSTDWQRVSGVDPLPSALSGAERSSRLVWRWRNWHQSGTFFYISFRKGILHVFIYLYVYTSENACFYI